MIFSSDGKLCLFNCFSVQGTCVRPSTPDPENRVCDRDTGSPGRPVFSGLQVPDDPANFRARARRPWWTYRGVFPSKCPSLAPAEMSNTPRWPFGLLEDNRWGGCRLGPKKSRREAFQENFTLGFFLGEGVRVEPLCRHSIDFSLYPGHWDITRFHPRSPIAPDRKSFGSPRKNPRVAQATGSVNDFDQSCGFRAYIAENSRMSKSSGIMGPTRPRKMSSYSALDLSEIRRSSKIGSWIWSIISGVVTDLRRPGRGAS